MKPAFPERARSIAFSEPPVIQALKLEAQIIHYEVADYGWTADTGGAERR